MRSTWPWWCWPCMMGSCGAARGGAGMCTQHRGLQLFMAGRPACAFRTQGRCRTWRTDEEVTRLCSTALVGFSSARPPLPAASPLSGGTCRATGAPRATTGYSCCFSLPDRPAGSTIRGATCAPVQSDMPPTRCRHGHLATRYNAATWGSSCARAFFPLCCSAECH